MRRPRTEADKKYDRKYRKAHPEVYARMRVKRRANLKAYLKKLKEENPCADCRKFFPHYVMDYDHRPGVEKLFMISRYAASQAVSTYGRLDTEIAKCDLVCANCHRIRTHQRAPFKPTKYPAKQAA